MPDVVGVEASSSLGRDVIGSRQSKFTGKTLCDQVSVRQFGQAHNGSLAGDNPISDPTSTDNDMEMKREEEQQNFHRMAKVHEFLEMWEGSQNLRATQKESRAQNKQMAAVEYISHTQEIVKASWSHFQHDGAAAFELVEKSAVQPALSAKDLPGGRNQVLSVNWIEQIDRHPPERDADSSPESISDTKCWLDWDGDLDNPNASKDDWEADNESDMELDNGSEDSDIPEKWNVCAALNVPGLIRSIRRSKKKVEMTLMTVNILKTRRETGMKKK